MTRVFLISDNHGFCDEALLHHAAMADEIWHAGDWLNLDLYDALIDTGKVLRAVWGNADGQELRRLLPEHLHFELEGLRVYITHIGGYPGKFSKASQREMQQYRPDVFVCGHSHILRVDRDPTRGNMICINPGACGLQGFHRVRTALRFELHEAKITSLEAIELGRRG